MNLHCIAFLVYLWFNIDGKLIRGWILAPLTAPKPDLLNKNVKNYVLPRDFICNMYQVFHEQIQPVTCILKKPLKSYPPKPTAHYPSTWLLPTLPPHTLTTLSLLSTPPPNYILCLPNPLSYPSQSTAHYSLYSVSHIFIYNIILYYNCKQCLKLPSRINKNCMLESRASFAVTIKKQILERIYASSHKFVCEWWLWFVNWLCLCILFFLIL